VRWRRPAPSRRPTCRPPEENVVKVHLQQLPRVAVAFPTSLTALNRDGDRHSHQGECAGCSRGLSHGLSAASALTRACNEKRERIIQARYSARRPGSAIQLAPAGPWKRIRHVRGAIPGRPPLALHSLLHAQSRRPSTGGLPGRRRGVDHSLLMTVASSASLSLPAAQAADVVPCASGSRQALPRHAEHNGDVRAACWRGTLRNASRTSVSSCPGTQTCWRAPSRQSPGRQASSNVVRVACCTMHPKRFASFCAGSWSRCLC